ncbi:hypothetical protein [Erwinia sp. E_sp_B04_7]
MTDRPLNGDKPDEKPIPDSLHSENEKEKETKKDDPGSAPESGDKDPE